MPRSIASRSDRDLLVLGPALDGGYYLVAATRVPPVFERITWGSADVLEQTCAAAAEAGMRVHFVDSLADVDTLEDLRTVAASSRTATLAAAERHPQSREET